MKMKRVWILGMLVIVMGTAIVFGIYLANRDKTAEEEIARKTSQKWENQVKNENPLENMVLQVASTEEKVSPNAILQKRTYYTVCDHLQVEEGRVEEEDVNSTKEEIARKYANWKIEKFSKDKIELYQEVAKMCSDHFCLREEQGVIVIEQADEQGKYHKIEETEINTKYLPEEDQEKLMQGIFIVGENQLNCMLEDYE